MSNLIRHVVADLPAVLLLYDRLEVHRCATETGSYVEVTAEATRPVLTSASAEYVWEHPAGLHLDWYKTRYRKAGTGTVSALSAAFYATPLYASLADARAEGVPTSIADARVLAALETWQAVIDRETRQWFARREATLTLDGSGSTLLQLAVPVVSVSALYLNGDFDTALSVDAYEVYTARRNPRVKLVTGEATIFEGVGSVNRSAFLFRVGERNQRIVGVFGCVEADGSTPAPIRRALLRLTLRALRPLWGSGGEAAPAGPVIEEETDRHRRKWSDGAAVSGAWSATGDPEVDQILALYRAPLVVRAPRTMFRRLSGVSTD